MPKKTTFDALEFRVTCRVWRRQHGFTQADVAGVCHMSSGKLSLIESGDVLPTMAELSRLCEFMEIDVTEFFKEKGKTSDAN